MISRMAKPEEVLVVESEDGEIVRETTKDTDALVRPREGNREKRAVPHLLCAACGVCGVLCACGVCGVLCVCGVCGVYGV